MCRFFLPVWLCVVLLCLGGCGLAWKFGYTFPATLQLEVQATTPLLPTSASTSTPPATSPAPAPATQPPAPTTQTTPSR